MLEIQHEAITIHETGPELTLQDKGRFGYQNIGLSPAGVADPDALRYIETQLQQSNPTLLQVLLGGLEFSVSCACTILVAGAAQFIVVNGNQLAVDRPILLNIGDRVQLPLQQRRRYSYLGFSPELAIEPVLGSTATHVREKIGPNAGRPLQAGTRLSLAAQAKANLALAEFSPSHPLLVCASQYDPVEPKIKSIDFFPSEWFKQHAACFYPRLKSASGHSDIGVSLSLFCLQSFVISAQSSAMGYRLHSSVSLAHHERPQTSAGTCLGMIQLPNNGEPIVLMQERQTIGGYPFVGCVAEWHIGKLAQCLPGDKICFNPVERLS